MKNKPTFKNIKNYGEITEENDFFIQFTNKEIPDHYEANYLLLKFSPSLQEFMLIEKMHKDYQKSIQQRHLKFDWPDNLGLHPELLSYFDKENYKIGMQYLYWITSDLFKIKRLNKNLSIQKVTDQNFDDFLRINLEEDFLHGRKYFEHKKRMYTYQYSLKEVTFLLAYLNDQAVGSLILIHSKDYIEVDNVLTKAEFRKNKVATSMFSYVVNELLMPEQLVILVADAEDTPKEMYEKMGFQYASYQITAQKDCNEVDS